jgi:tRNA A-37 threonylcarbamoyl transferase component Bud32
MLKLTDELPDSPFDGLSLIKKFPSKKNRVYLVERDCTQLVLKLYDNDRCAYEYGVLKVCRDEGIAVPEPLELKGNALLMEYVEGRLANDYVNAPDMWDVVLDIASWLALFHGTFRYGKQSLLKSDVNFKNFIVGDRLYGLDFELSKPGKPEADVGDAIAYLVSTYPMFTDEKFELSLAFIGRYEEESGIKLEDVDSSVALSLREAAVFRPSQHDALLKKAEEIVSVKPFTRSR